MIDSWGNDGVCIGSVLTTQWTGNARAQHTVSGLAGTRDASTTLVPWPSVDPPLCTERLQSQCDSVMTLHTYKSLN